VWRRFGIEDVLERNARLSERLSEGLTASRPGIKLFAPAHRSTIVSMAVDDVDSVMARLRAAGVVASARAGRVRLSVHFYNREEEIDRVVELLAT
jgi:selenocysteine lyase/cysteine desulfurase